MRRKKVSFRAIFPLIVREENLKFAGQLYGWTNGQQEKNVHKKRVLCSRGICSKQTRRMM